MESSSVGCNNMAPDNSTPDTKAPAEGEPPSQHGGDNVAAAADVAPTSGRPSESARSTSGTGGGEQVTHQMTHSYSLSAIPTDQGHRDKKKASTRYSLPTGYTEASYRGDEYAHRQSPKQQQQQQLAPHQMDSLPRPYPPQSKSFGYTTKDLSRSMGSTALQREDSSGGCAADSFMAKGEPGRAVRVDYKAHVPHGLSRSLPKQSYFPDQQGERMYYPSRSAVCLQELPQKQQYAQPYYTPQMLRKADNGGRVASSSSFKPKRFDDRCGEQQRYYTPYSSGYVYPMAAYDDAEYRKQMAAYTGDQRWMYSHYAAYPQQYAVHMMQEASGNEACREAGDNVGVKSSGDSGGEVSKFAKQAAEDASSMYVIVRDAQTGTDTPLPATADVGEESPPPSKAAGMPLLGKDAARQKHEDSESSTSSSSDEDDDDEEESSSSSSESSSSSASSVKKGRAKDYLTSEVKQRIIAQQLQDLQIQHQQQLMNITPQEYASYQEALRIYENYCQKVQNQEHQQQLMMQHRQQIQQQQSFIQQQSLQQLAQPQQPPPQPPPQLPLQKPPQKPPPPPQLQQQVSQPQFYQQQKFDPRAGALPEKKKSVYFTGSEGAGEMAARVPGEGSSIRSFQSRTSNDVGTGEASVDDSRSLLSSNTNMGTPLLRPLLPERAARTATKDKMEHLCLAVNVILFSVLAGVVAAFIVQQVTHAI